MSHSSTSIITQDCKNAIGVGKFFGKNLECNVLLTNEWNAERLRQYADRLFDVRRQDGHSGVYLVEIARFSGIHEELSENVEVLFADDIHAAGRRWVK